MKHRIQRTAILLTALIAGGIAFSSLAFSGTVHPEYGMGGNLNDPHVLIGQSHNVFVGTVVESLGERNLVDDDDPCIEYRVMAIVNIKGNLTKDLDICQFVKVDRQAPLVVGASYIFFSRYHSEWSAYVFGSAYGHRLFSERDVTREEVKKLADRSAIVRELGEAYRNEVKFEYDVSSNEAYNACATRCLDANGELIDDTVQLAREKEGLEKVQCVTALKAGEPSPGWTVAGTGSIPATSRNILLAIAALAILASAATTAYVIRHAIKRKGQLPKKAGPDTAAPRRPFFHR